MQARTRINSTSQSIMSVKIMKTKLKAKYLLIGMLALTLDMANTIALDYF